MIRLDKFLTDMNTGTRSAIKKEIRNGAVTVDGSIIKSPEYKVSEDSIITYKGQIISYQQYSYYMLNKPAGCISATKDTNDSTVLELLPVNLRKNVFPVGRLDKDTEGLLLLTDDGELAHNLLSPKKHVSKTYYVELEHAIATNDITLLEQGVDIGEKKLTLPSHIEQLTDTTLRITITEGKYHQVKRMFQAVHNQVVYLKRISMGKLILDSLLPTGAYRVLTLEEINDLKEITGKV